MSDLIAGRVDLADFTGLAACGGFSYGDVLGAGRGWATSILERDALRDAFAAFFARERHVLARRLQRLPDAEPVEATSFPAPRHWPRFLRNRSEQFEARLALLEVVESPSLFLRGHGGFADSRWRWRMAKAAPSSTAPADQRAATGRLALRRRRGPRSRRTIRSIPTARPMASPA